MIESVSPDRLKHSHAMLAPDLETSCLIVGAGPAGLGPLVAASTSDKLQALLKAGITIVEAGPVAGCGEIGRYAISSDSAAEAFLDAISGTEYPQLAKLKDHHLAAAIRGRIGRAIPLKQAAQFLQLVGESICTMVKESRRGHVLMQHRVLYTRRTNDGGWITTVRDEQQGTLRQIRSKSVIVATGAEQPLSRLYSEEVAGQALLPKYAGKVLQSGYALTAGGLRQIRRELAAKRDPRVAIVGGSASAGAVAKALLNDKLRIPFGSNGVTIVHRRPLRIFYPSAADALSDGYTDFEPQDICPVSGRVYRLAGFRLESRELMMRVLRVGGRDVEPRVRLQQVVPENTAETSKILDDAHVIVAAMGYRPRALTVLDAFGNPISLQCDTDDMVPMVGGSSNVINASGRVITGLYGIGLASGFVPRGRFGGEPSFKGQANSLWLWQHDIGEQIATAVLHDATALSVSNCSVVPSSYIELPREQQKGVA
jgi:cation diffusion facilitator CzcD-associated flavoprotein CzcO